MEAYGYGWHECMTDTWNACGCIQRSHLVPGPHLILGPNLIPGPDLILGPNKFHLLHIAFFYQNWFNGVDLNIFCTAEHIFEL